MSAWREVGSGRLPEVQRAAVVRQDAKLNRGLGSEHSFQKEFDRPPPDALSARVANDEELPDVSAAGGPAVKRVGDSLSAQFEQCRFVFAPQPPAHSFLQPIERKARARSLILDEFAVQAGQQRHVPEGGGAMGKFHGGPVSSDHS